MWTAVSGEPVNEIRRTPGCRVSAAPDLLADPLHDVEDTRRQPAFDDEVAEKRARERRPLGGLEDHGAARGERGGGLPGGEHERRVPRCDHDRRAARHADHAVPRAVRLPYALLVARPRNRRRLRKFRAPREITRARSERSSIAMSAHSTAASRSTFASIRSASRWRWSARPRAPSAAHAGNAAFAAATASSASRSPPRDDLGERLRVDGRDVDEGRVARDPLAADEVLGRDLDARDLTVIRRPPQTRAPRCRRSCYRRRR